MHVQVHIFLLMRYCIVFLLISFKHQGRMRVCVDTDTCIHLWAHKRTCERTSAFGQIQLPAKLLDSFCGLIKAISIKTLARARTRPQRPHGARVHMYVCVCVYMCLPLGERKKERECVYVCVCGLCVCTIFILTCRCNTEDSRWREPWVSSRHMQGAPSDVELCSMLRGW